MHRELLSVLVVNHNQPIYTYNVLRDLESQTVPANLFVINNGCTEEGKVNHKAVKVNYLHNEHLNTLWNGFKGATDSMYLCFMNNDVRVTDNFIEDTIRVFEANPDVGIVIHITNRPDYIASESTLKYDVLNIPLCQGWDFTIRRDILPVIPSSMKIFGGDDYIFSSIVKEGWRVALVISSPIIHYKEKTRQINPNISNIQSKDQENFFRIIKEKELKIISNTNTIGVCVKYCDKETEEAFLNANNKI